jgi:hypothetical protein
MSLGTTGYTCYAYGDKNGDNECRKKRIRHIEEQKKDTAKKIQPGVRENPAPE